MARSHYLKPDEKALLVASGKKMCAACGEEKFFKEFYKNPHGILGLNSYCKPCTPIVNNKTRSRRSNEYYRLMSIIGKHGVSISNGTVILASGVCPICHKKSSNLVHDHCHTTGKQRGRICGRCNILVGYLESSKNIIPVALAYIEYYKKN